MPKRHFVDNFPLSSCVVVFFFFKIHLCFVFALRSTGGFFLIRISHLAYYYLIIYKQVINMGLNIARKFATKPQYERINLHEDTHTHGPICVSSVRWLFLFFSILHMCRFLQWSKLIVS